MNTILGNHVQEDLRQLERKLPGRGTATYQLARHVADYIWPSISPEDFVHAYFLALGDLQTAGDRRSTKTQRPPHELVGCPAELYAVLALDIPQIADAIFPEDFAGEVKEVFRGGRYKIPY
ncbi:MAG: hypothetical protein HYT72_00755 [Candidatus Aenigmarchaeota archaeon]|nr:hypothetical protein [Candidatus Aenigmarchaeota archaeon]